MKSQAQAAKEMKWKDKLHPHPDAEEMWLLIGLHRQPHLHTEKGRWGAQRRWSPGMFSWQGRAWLLDPARAFLIMQPFWVSGLVG